MDSAVWILPPAAVQGVPSVCPVTAPGRMPVLAWPSAGLPVVLPIEVFTPQAQAGFATIPGLLSTDRRVGILLADEQRSLAFAIATRDARPLGAQGRLELELAGWAAREQARLGLPATRGPVIVVGDDSRGTLAADVRGALDDVRILLAPLPWPRWAGPVVVFIGSEDRGIPLTGVARPALPLLQFPDAACGLVPPAAWPAWPWISLSRRRRGGRIGFPWGWPRSVGRGRPAKARVHA